MRDAFAGALGSGLMVMVTQPMDTCKVNLQQHTSYAKSPSVVARGLTSTGGVRVLWAGTLPALYLYVTEHAVLFGTWSYFCRSFWPAAESRPETVPPLWLGLSCGLCCIGSSMLTCPADFLKCRLQVYPGVFKGAADCLTRTVAAEGTRTLFMNYRSVLLRDALFFSGYVTTHETLCRHWMNWRGIKSKEELTFMELFTLGGTAGTIGWLLASPADVINSRRQGRVSPADRPLVPPPSSVAPMSLLTEMRHVATTEGTHVLWTGMRFQVARGFVGYGTFTVGYTLAVNMWNNLQPTPGALPLPCDEQIEVLAP